MVYYYAYINSANICEQVYAMPSPITGANYILLDTYDTSLIGKRYNADTGLWEEVTWYYYAQLDDRDIVVEIISNPDTPLAAANDLIQISSADTTLIGKWYNRETQQFVEAPIHVLAMHSTDEINVGEEDKWLSTELEEINTAIETLETDKHTHSNKEVLDGITAEKVAAWDNGTGGSGEAGAAGADGEDGVTFTPAVSADGVISWTNNGGLENPTPVNIKGADGEDGTNGTNGVTFIPSVSADGVLSWTNDGGLTNPASVNIKGADGTSGSADTAEQVLEKIKGVDGANSGLDADLLDGHNSDYFATAEQLANKANSDHTHDGYATAESVTALTNTVNGKADTNHTHDNYATTTALANKADTGHTHSQSDISGLATALAGKSDTGHTHSGYASSSHTHSEYADKEHTHSQYSLSGHSHTTNGSCEFTGTIRTRDIVSGNAGNCNIGGYSNRYKFIYSVNQLQVESDERAKKDIVGLSTADLCDFVQALNVVEYKYKADETNKARIGLIAQEIIAANPKLADYFVRKEENGMLGLSVADLVFPLIATVQELAKEIEQLKK